MPGQTLDSTAKLLMCHRTPLGYINAARIASRSQSLLNRSALLTC